jgi:hypothetical protein
MKNRFKVNPVFQEILLVVLSLTLLSGGASCWIASQSNLSPQQDRIFESTTATWQTGIGVLFGLLGSKVTDLLQPEEDEDDK